MKKLIFLVLLFPLLNYGQAKNIAQLRDSLDNDFFTEVVGGYTQKSLLTATSNGGNGGDLYYNYERAMPLIDAFMGSGHRAYLDEAIIGCNNWIASSTIASQFANNNNYNDSFMGWQSNNATSITGQGTTPNGTYPNGTENGLYDSRGWMPYAKMLWVLKNSPSLRAESTIVDGKTYQQHYNDILAFTETHIFNKWETRQSGDVLFSSAVDRSAAFAYIGLFLWKCTGTQKYKNVFDEFNTGANYGFRSHIEVNDFDASAWQWCILWSCNVYEGNRISDHGHASRAAKYVVDANMLGEYWTNADVVKIMNTFKVIAPIGSTDRQAYKWMNRDNSSGDDLRPKYHEGFTSAARIDETYQQRLENKTTVYEKTVYTRSLMFGALVFNRAYLNGTVQYPENFYQNTGTPTIVLANSDIKATPLAEGFGKNATGGKGLGVFFVTNTNENGAGSLKQALLDAATANGGNIIPRTGGTISLTSDLNFPNTASNISIYGQAAPGGGLAIYSGETTIFGQNLILQHLRFRGGDDAKSNDEDTFRMSSQFETGTRSNYFFDNLTFSWGGDEVVSIETGTSGQIIQNTTFQDCIISESFNSKGMIIWGQGIVNLSILNNLFSNNSERNVRSSTGGGTYEQINNLVQNYTAGLGPTFTDIVDFMGNDFRDGSSTQSFQTVRWEPCSTANCPPSGVSTWSTSQLYATDNTWNGGAATYGAAGATVVFSGSRLNGGNYVPRASSTVEDYILANVGAGVNTAQGRDSNDQNQIDDVINDGGAFVTTESAAGGVPTLAIGTPYTDTDSDGLSDVYEAANGGNVTQSDIPATAVLSDGTILDQANVTNYATNAFTHLQIFMADLAGEWDGFTRIGGGIIPEIPRIIRKRKNYEVLNRSRKN